MAEIIDDILLSVGLDIEKVKAQLNELSNYTSKIEKQLSSSKEKIQKEQVYEVASYKKKSAKATSKILSNINKKEVSLEIKYKKEAEKEAYNYKYHLMAQSTKDAKKFYNDMTKIRVKEYKKALAKEKLLDEKKKKDEEKAFARSAKGALSNNYGTTLGHKAVTTSQYIAIGAAIYGVSAALEEVAAMSIKYDNALFQNMAVLQLNRQESASLLEANYDVAISYGVVVDELNKATITLGRAGIAYDNLAEATRVTAQLAKITGDSLDKASEVVSTFTIAYGLASNQVHALGNELAYAANASRLSIEDLGTMSNYAIAGAKTLGLTKEAVLALATSFSNIGVNASTIGTQIRKFGKLVRDETKSTDKFFNTIGIKQKELAKGLKGINSDEDFLEFVQRVGDMTDDAYEKATSGMEILTKQFVDSIRISSNTIENHLSKIKDSGDTLEAQARIQALSIEGLWNSAVATVDKAVSGIATSIADRFTNRRELEQLTEAMGYFNAKTKEYIELKKIRNSLMGNTAKSKISFNVGETKEETEKYLSRIDKRIDKTKEKIGSIIEQIKSGELDPTYLTTYTNRLAKLTREQEALNKQLLIYSQQKEGFKGNTIIDSKLLEQLKKAEQGLKLLKANIPEDRLKLLREESEKLKNTWKELDSIGGDTNKILKAKLDYINAEKKVTVVQNSLLNEQIALRKKLTKEITATSSQSPESKKYDSFVAKYEEEKRAAKGNKETLLLIDKWYQQQLDILNQEEVAKFEKKSQRELEIKSKLARADIENKYAKQSNGITDEVELLELKKQKLLEILAIDVTANSIKNDLINLSKVDADITAQKLKNEQHYNNFIMSANTDILDSQIALAKSGTDWANSLTGVAGELQNVAKSFNNINVIRKKGTKEALSIDNKYFKEYQKYAKKQILTEKDKQEIEVLGNKQIEEINASKLATQQAEIAGYASLAGAMGNMFEEGTAGAKAFGAIQATLGIINAYTAITNALATPPAPVGIALGAMVASQVAPIIGTLISLGGSGGSSGGATAIDYTQQRIDTYDQSATDLEEANKPITDRLDRQIQLLEKISGLKNTYGDLIALEIEKASAEYGNTTSVDNTRNLGLVGASYYLPYNQLVSGANILSYRINYDNAVYDNIAGKFYGFANDELVASISNEVNSTYDMYDSLLGDAITLNKTMDYNKTIRGWYNSLSGDVWATLNDDYLTEGANLIDFLQKLSSVGSLDLFGVTAEEYDQIMNEAQQATADFVDSTLDGLLSLVDVSKTFKELADGLRGDDFYKNQNLQKAIDDVNSMYGTDYLHNSVSVFADVLDESIKKIQLLEDSLSSEDIMLLQSQNEEDIVAQAQLVATLNDDLTAALNSGALETINYKDSIELVAQAMINSNNNIKSWEDSFKTQDELLNDMANSLGVNVATTLSELDNLFEVLKGGLGGLTDSELEFLNANKDTLQAMTGGSNNNNNNSNNNIKSWKDSFKTKDELLNDMASSLGVNVATTLSELDNLFEVLKDGLGGLTDSELKFLNANKDSIELVAQAMINSNNNIKSWKDSFKTPNELLDDMASSLGVNVATTLSELDNLFEVLKDGLDGLTNSELKFLNANKNTLQAMTDGSNNNIKSWKDSFKTQNEILNDMASSLGVNVATTLSELDNLFEVLKGGLDGLTNSELKFLNANKNNIELVAQAMIDSNNNIKSWKDSFKTPNELLNDTANSLGVNVATTLSELDNLFEVLKGGLDGLTDSELEFLNANKDSIELVAQAMVDSNNNIKSWKDSFKTPDELLDDMASSLGVNVATTLSELDNLFEVLKGGLGGLTDSELEFLNANKDALQAMTDELNNTIDSFQSLSDSLQNKIDELNGTTKGETYTLEQFYASMSKALTTNPYNAEAYNSAIEDAIAKSSILSNADAFETSRDQQFAQLVAANQFDELNIQTLTQIDYLKLISDNTYNTVRAVKGVDFSDQINEIYQDKLHRNATSAGINYWLSDIASGQSISDVATSISASPEAQIVGLYDKYGATPDSEGVTYWLNDIANGQSIDDVANSFKTIFGYSNGGYTGDFGVNDIAGVVHGQEYVIDAPTTRDLGLNGNGGVFKEMVVELKNIRYLIEIQANEIRSLRKENEDQTQILESIDRSVA